ncbi:MAG: hypothetical protein AAFU65_17250 [Pseudomonadota bacterium]
MGRSAAALLLRLERVNLVSCKSCRVPAFCGPVLLCVDHEFDQSMGKTDNAVKGETQKETAVPENPAPPLSL